MKENLKSKKLSNAKMIEFNKEINNMAIFLQAIIVALLAILSVCSIFLPNLEVIPELLLASALLIMGYNNYITYKRRGFTLLYIVAGIITIVVIVVSMFYGI